MNRIFTTTLFLLTLVASSFAQTAIPNASFESWENSGANIEPVSWNSNKSGTGFANLGPQTCFQSTTAHSGNYSAKVVSSTYFGTVVNGSLTTGRVNAPATNKLDGYISDSVAQTGFISSFTGRPDSLIFWYQYTSVSNDYPTVEARLHVNNAYAPETPYNTNHPVCTANIVSRALWQGAASSSTGGWNRVAVPFVYVDGRTPGYILITTTSSGNQNGGSANSTLYLDDFLAYYIPVLTTSTNVATGPYYVSAGNSASISVPFTLTGTVDSTNVVTAQLSDANGSFTSPVTLGTLATLTSGTISGTIPAGTATGTGYRVRVVSNHPSLTAADNGSNITIDLVGNSIAPSTTQNIAANTNGTLLTVTENPTATSRQWQSSTTSGGPYTAISGQTATTYTPNFSTAGTYYVVCVSAYPGNLSATSNQVQINVVANSIAPTTAQSLLVGVNGNVLTVTETPNGASRQWASGTTSGGPYTSIGGQTGMTYTPNFASAGSYYVVCKSVISGITATSNEVLVSVGTSTLATGTITGSPFLFSPTAPAASVSVPYTVSSALNGGNVFTAQLSDASGSFASATNIGNVTASNSGTITASIPSNTPAGTGYRIRVVSSAPVLLGSDNGTDLVVDQFHNSIAPTTTQTIMYGTNGSALTVTPSQTGAQNWQYSIVSGSGYVDFAPTQTGNTYTPNFATPGTYYVVCVSTNSYTDAVTSNEVQIIVTNGTTLTTLNVSGSPFLVSDSSHAAVSVNYTSDVQFNGGNTFQAQLSDNAGGFSNPVIIGTLTSTSSMGTVASVIPNSTAGSTHYRIRVVSSNPAINGTPDSTDITVIPFAVAVSPTDTQHLIRHQNGNLLTATSSQPASYNWQVSAISGTGYQSFIPAQTANTLVPVFSNVNTYYVVCNIKNADNAALYTPEVVIVVTLTNAITGIAESTVKAYWDNNSFVVDLSDAKLNAPVLQLMNIAGQVVLNAPLAVNSNNRFATQLPEGVYVFNIVDGQQSFTGKTAKK